MPWISKFLARQGSLVLENYLYALLYIVFFTLLHFTSWLAGAIVALLTLRKGWWYGLQSLLMAVVTLCIAANFNSHLDLHNTLLNACIEFGSIFFIAILLRFTKNWQLCIWFLVICTLIAIIFIHAVMPYIIDEHYKIIQILINKLEQDGILNNLLYKPKLEPIVIANYILGFQAIGVDVAAISSLMLARSVQASLFYPGGYKKEIINFKANRWGIIFLLLSGVGVYKQNAIAISCLPILTVYYASGGVNLIYQTIKNIKKNWTLFVFILSFIMLPMVMIVIYVILGILDSMFNLQLRHYISKYQTK